jgi:UDP-N-acetylglucosamine acyltransferase
MNNIHPTAVISGKAKLGDNITISAFAVVEDDVEIGNDCEIGPHTVIYNGARIGNRVKIKQGAAVSNVSQDLKYKNEEAFFYVEDDSIIREFVTLHKGTKETGFSKVGKNCLLMAYSHVAHDVVIGDNCIIANGVQIGGHATIEEYVIIGGETPVHQFSKIGKHSMIAGAFRVIKDIPPYIIAAGEPLKFAGLNVLGLRRRGFSNDDIMTLKKTYKLLYNSGFNFSDAIKKITEEIGEHDLVQNVVEFIKKSDRGIIGR